MGGRFSVSHYECEAHYLGKLALGNISADRLAKYPLCAQCNRPKKRRKGPESTRPWASSKPEPLEENRLHRAISCPALWGPKEHPGPWGPPEHREHQGPLGHQERPEQAGPPGRANPQAQRRNGHKPERPGRSSLRTAGILSAELKRLRV